MTQAQSELAFNPPNSSIRLITQYTSKMSECQLQPVQSLQLLTAIPGILYYKLENPEETVNYYDSLRLCG